jgi:hypothetical protein
MTLGSLSARGLVARREVDAMEALESRVMLANTTVFTDADGDRVTVRLTGPGTATPTLSAGASGFIDFLALAGTTADSALTISVKKAGGDGRVLALGVSSAVLKSFVAPTTDLGINASATFEGITRFSVGLIPAGAGFSLITPAGKPVAIAVNLLAGNLVVTGAVSSLRAVSVFSSAAVNASSTMGPIRVTSGLAGDWRADNYARITTGADLSGEWRARTPNAKGYSFGAIRAQSVSGLYMDADEFNVFGRIASVTVALSVVNTQIIARGVDTLRVGGIAEDLELELNESDPAKFAIKSATILGSVDGEWDVGTRVGTLRFGQTLEGFEFNGGNASHVGSITFLGNPFSRGDWSMTSLGALTSAGPVGGDWLFTGTIPGSNLGLRTATPARLLDGDFQLNAGGLGTLTTQEINNVDLRAEFFRTIVVKPGSQGQGDYRESFLAATGATGDGSTNQWSITALSVRGVSDNVGISTRSSVKSMTFGRFLDSRVIVGSTDPLMGVPAFGDTALLDASRRLGSFRVTAPFALGHPAVSGFPRVTAATIGRVFLNGEVNPELGGDHGFLAGVFTSITLRASDGARVTFAPLTPSEGEFAPFAPSVSDFVFRAVPL